MTTKQIIETLSNNGYSTRLIARQCQISHTRLYRYMTGSDNLQPLEHANVERFAKGQPCMEGLI